MTDQSTSPEIGKPPMVAAFDLATTTGWAFGRPGETPQSGSICFGKDCSQNAVFANALAWASKFFATTKVDILICEGMLPPSVMAGETTRGTYERLAGLHGVIRGVAHCRRVFDISEVSVADVRGHFIGARNLRSHVAKHEVLQKCRQLGWPVQDHNAADACAVWHFACSLINPELALQTSPLFHRRAAE
jgi:hypothetical protein